MRRAAATVAAALGTAGLVHCANDESLGANPVVTPSPVDGSVEASEATLLDAGPAAGPTLCEKSGGEAAVRRIADDLFAKVQADCRVGTYFTRLSAAAATDVKACMQAELAAKLRCAGVSYPPLASATPSGRACRSMAEAHATLAGTDGRLGLNENDFSAYLQAVQVAFKGAGVADADITKVVALFSAQKGAVATRASEGNTACACAGNTFEGASCVPDGGYKPIDAGKDSAAPKDSGALVDVSVVDASSPADATTPTDAPSD